MPMDDAENPGDLVGFPEDWACGFSNAKRARPWNPSLKTGSSWIALGRANRNHLDLLQIHLGPPVERLESGYQLFSVYSSRGTLPTKKG